MKTKEEIRATTDRIPRPANYKYGEKLKEWDATPASGAEDSLSRIKDLLNDRIVVKLIEPEAKGSITLIHEAPLIGGMRKAIVLKCGPGKWMPGDWRRPMAVRPGMVVWIGNWVDLETNGLALCQEGDIRVYVGTDCGNS